MNDLEYLSERVARLERRLRLTTRFALSILLAGGALLIVGQAAPEGAKPEGRRVIEADEFVIRDDKGNLRVRISASGGNSSIVLIGGNGKQRVSLVVSQEAHWSGMTAYSEHEGHEASGSVVARHDTAEVAVKRNKSGQSARYLAAVDGKVGKLSQNDLDDLVELLASDQVRLFVRDSQMAIDIEKDGKERSHWSVTPESTEISLMDKHYKLRGFWNLQNNEASLTLADQTGKSRLILGQAEIKDTKSGTTVQKSESSILLFGEDGKVIFSAP